MNIAKRFLTHIEDGALLLLAQALIFLQPVSGSIWAIGFLVMSDLLTALIREYYLLPQPDGNKLLHFFRFNFNSRKLARTLYKFLFYSVLLIVALILHTMVESSVPFVKVTIGLIVFVEVKSMVENFDRAMGTNIWQLLNGFFKNKVLPRELNEDKPAKDEKDRPQ